MEKEFKIGDKIKVTGNSGASHTPIGSIGIIEEFQSHSPDRIKISINSEIQTKCPWINKGDYEHYQEYIVLDVVLEEKFVLPEIWHIIVTKENQDIVTKWREVTGDYKLPIGHLTGITKIGNNLNKGHNPGKSIRKEGRYGFDFGEEITFEQFKKYVLKEKSVFEPLPFFKVLIGDEAENTIVQVQNNEGNVFQIGDKIKGLGTIASNAGTMIISRFRYTNDRSNICACTKQFHDYGIGIDKIEHVLEFKKDEIVLDIIKPKIPENESNLDKAKRLYPVGTTYLSASSVKSQNTVVVQSFQQINPEMIYGESGKGCLYYYGKWAEIISKPEIKEEPIVITSSLKDMLELQNKDVKNVISIQPQKEETLLEKAERLYPPGTQFVNAIYGKETSVYTTGIVKTYDNKPKFSNSLHSGNEWIVFENRWAKILYNGYKVGDIIRTPRHYSNNGNIDFNRNYPITKLETIDGQEVVFFGDGNKHNRILIKNIKK